MRRADVNGVVTSCRGRVSTSVEMRVLKEVEVPEEPLLTKDRLRYVARDGAKTPIESSERRGI